MKKQLFVVSAICIASGIIIFFIALGIKKMNSVGNPNWTKQIFAQNAILKEGDRLVDQGFYDEALQKYNEALSSLYVRTKEDKRQPIIRRMRLYRSIGDYKKALIELAILHRERVGTNDAFEEEIKILMKATEKKTANPVLGYIALIKERDRKTLPPQGYIAAYSSIPISTILRLYNVIGDHDAGIAYIDDCMNYFKAHDIQKYGEYRPGKANVEYFKIREAFEQDKANGFRGCLETEPGEVCMGRATKALIRSNYFLW